MTEASVQASGALPFAGLGFDLAGVVHRARLYTLRVPRVEQPAPCAVPEVRTPSGYGLQLRLGRETRAG